VKRLLIWGVLVALGWLLWRNVAAETGPAMRAKCAEICDQMLEKMPESFPPNRMMADLDHLKEQTDRILNALQDRQADDTSAS
jgi:hypothetical protein